MADRQSYPSPDAVDTREGGPFYRNAPNESNEEVPPPAEEVANLELGGDKPQEQELRHDHSHELQQEEHQEQEFNMADFNNQLQQHINPDLQQSTCQDMPSILAQHDQTHTQHIAQEVMNQVHDGSVPPYPASVEHHSQPATPGASMAVSMGSSGKPRSKVSRACDECRRKKVRQVHQRT
jgi:hypothetical protein